MKRNVCAVATIFAVLLGLASRPAAAQDENRAGLVVVTGDGTVKTVCVPFTAESIDGYSLLQQAGFDLSVEAAGTGVTICAINGEGCTYPQSSCFCRCQGSPCVYWSFWQLEETGWRYATMGASYVHAQDGDVQAWRWAEGTVTDAPEPPVISFEEICADPGPAEGPNVGTLVTTSTAAIPMALTISTSRATTVAPGLTVTEPDRGPTGQLAGAAPEPVAQTAPGSPQGVTPALAITLGALLVAPIAGLALWASWRRTRRGRD